MSSSFPAKLLLFGEYTVLNGSQALSVPLHKFSGRWIKSSTVNSPLPEYFTWLRTTEIIDDEILRRMIKDHAEGWKYAADVPVGYGVGSSGTYVAAIYDRYIHEGQQDFQKITGQLALMENYFHGSSSGMDPLVSYSSKAVYKDERGNFHLLEDEGWPEGFRVFLLDSGYARETSALVQLYEQIRENHSIFEKIERDLMPAVEHAIHFYLAKEGGMLEECLSLISQFQRKYFQDMIPDAIRSKWDELSGHEGVYVKLCGAGGGGFFLGISTNAKFNTLEDGRDYFWLTH